MGTPRRPLWVLVVEDSADDAELMALELHRYGFDAATERVETADAMRAALDRREWDAILADYSLPHFSATLALAMVQERGLDVPFILVSGTVGEETAVAAMKSGAHDFVLKGSLGRLGAAVARELRDAEERRQRRKAEAALTLLADLSQLLTEMPDHHAVLRRAVDLTVPALADWCILYSSGEQTVLDAVEVASVDSVDRDALRTLAERHRPRVPPRPEDGDPIAEALRDRKGVLTRDVTAEVLARIAPDPAHRALLQRLGLDSMIALPLLVGERVTGLWIFGAIGPRRYAQADLALARAVAGRIALVAENARLYLAREEFLSAAVHEIKTPIAVIKLAVQLLREVPLEPGDTRLTQFLIRIERQCDRLTRLVTNVLESSRMQLRRISLVRVRTDLDALVEAVTREMRDASPAHRIFVRPSEPLALDIDPDRVEQVLINLIDNAVRYSPGGGDVEVAWRREGDEAIVSVRDHGVGIPLDRQPRVFERFYRAHASTLARHAASLGVGLHLSREFVVRHGGRIWFESREGEGSTFYFSLPLHASARTRREPDGTHGR